MTGFDDNFGKGFNDRPAAPQPAERQDSKASPKEDDLPALELYQEDVAPARRGAKGRQRSPARRSLARSKAKEARVVKLLLWGRRDQGKTAYLWALGHRLTSARTSGFRFTERLPSYQKHWALLDKQLKSSWQRTTGEKEIKGGQLELFVVRRDRASRLFGGIEVELHSMDIPGEQIAEEAGYKQDAQSDARVMSDIREQIQTADACFIVARADEMMKDGAECARQADFIRQSLRVISREGGAATRTAIVLTACDAIPDEAWRTRLGFNENDTVSAGAAARRKEARAFLVDRDPLIAEGLDQFSDLGVFAVSSWGVAPEEDDQGNKSVVRAQPRFVEEPVAWILESEFATREAARRARRRRRIAAVAAGAAMTAVLAAQLLVAPIVRAFEPDAMAAALAPEAAALPGFVLELQQQRALAALVADAVSAARQGDDAAADRALATLAELDHIKYSFSRAFLEVSRIRVSRWRSAEGGARAAADEVRFITAQADGAEALLDRYGRSVIRLRALLARVRGVASPDDAATREIYQLLGADRLLAMQHGGDLLSSLWDQWIDAGLEARELPVVLARLDEAAALIARPEWLDLLRVASLDLADTAFGEMACGDSSSLVRLLNWHRDDALVHEVVVEGIRAAYDAKVGVAADVAGPRPALAREFALCFSQNSWVAKALPGFLFEVLDVLVFRREEEAILKIDPKDVAGAVADGLHALAAAEWAAIHPRTRLESRSALVAMQEAFQTRIAEAPAARALGLFERFSFVAGLLGRRFGVLREDAAAEVAKTAIDLLGRDDVMRELEPTRVRFLVASLSPGGSVPEPALIDALVTALVDNADDLPPATLAAVVDIAVGWVESLQGGDDLNSALAASILQLSSQIVERSFRDTPEFTGTYLGRLATCRFLIPLEPDQQEVLDETIGDVARNLIRLDKWDSEASSGFARWLVMSASVEKLTQWMGGEGGFDDQIARDMVAALQRLDVQQFSLLLRGLARLKVGAAAAALIDDLRRSSQSDQAAVVVGAAVIFKVLEDLDSTDALREELFEVCSAALDALFEAAGAERLSPARTAAFEYLAETLVSARAAGRQLSTRVTRRLQVEYLRLALAQIEAGRPSDTAASLANAFSWGEVSTAQVGEASAGLSDALDVSLKTVLALRIDDAALEVRLTELREQLCKAAFTRCDRVEDLDQLLTQLERCCDVWGGQGPRSPALTSRLQGAAGVFADRGEWARFVDTWRVAARCALVGLTPNEPVPACDDALVRRLADSSALAVKEGWSASAAVSAVRSLALLDGVDEAQCKKFCKGLVEKLVQRFRASGARRGDAAAREFVCEVSVGMLGDLERGSPDLVEALCDVFVADLLQGGADADLEMVVRSVPPVDAAAFSARLGVKIGGQRLRAQDCLALLTAVARGARPEQYRAALRAMCGSPCPLTASETLSVLAPAQTAKCWDRALTVDLFGWLKPKVLAETKRLCEATSLGGGLDALAELLEVTSKIASTAAAEDAHDDFLREVGGELERRLASMSAERLAAFDDALQPFPALATRIGAVRVLAAARRSDWVEARAAAARIAERGLRERLERFLAAAPSMAWIQVDGEDLLMRRDEVSVADYRQFLDALRRDPAVLARLTKAAKLTTEVTLAELEPGKTRADLAAPDMPVHKVCWVGARLYAEWIGQELPSLRAYGVAWGDGVYPWGNSWVSANSNTKERQRGGAQVSFESVASGVTAGGAAIRHLHGNVAEYVLDSSPLGEVAVFGASAWSEGKTVTRGNWVEKFAERGARTDKRTGVGFRTVLRLPTRD